MPTLDTEIPPLPAQLVLGIPEMDGEHSRLFVIHALLSECEAGSDDSNVLKTAALLLRDYANQHLAHEEMVLAANGYPATAAHIRQHDDLRKTVADMVAGVQDGTTSLQTLETFVGDWLASHIGKSDRAYADYFAGRPVEIPPMSVEAMLAACGDDDDPVM